MEVKFSRFSTWYKLKGSVAWILRLQNKLLHKEIAFQSILVDELDRAEKEIIKKCVQRECFSEQIIQLRFRKATYTKQLFAKTKSICF